MHYDKKKKELSFHRDRLQHSSNTMFSSIVENPTLSPEEKLALIEDMAKEHIQIGQNLLFAIQTGVDKGVKVVLRGS